ncbi:GGDEF domain-containing protein [Actinoplanes sp. ATCC 53533]|uniref:GGDEF domain-containing protein n=1 Tax=Actinoplanes sp. ATCC 53533 TaxID=1288362 RepID=UPI0013150D66|nr:GGDEF domain-containing protein [Actinoplanes sp. ATCC 53533]
MSTDWLSRRGIRRVATAGLAVGLAALATLAIVGTRGAKQATAQVRASNQVSIAWQSVFVEISEQDAALRQYLATGTSLDRAALRAVIGSAEEQLDWLTAHGGSDAAFQVVQLRRHYARYENTLHAVAAAGEQGQPERIEAHVQSAAPEFSALRRMSVANIERERRGLAAYLAAADGRNQALQSIAVGVIIIDLATFALCAAILIGYQRRVERQAASSHHQATHDALTGLANRVLFHDRAQQALNIAARTRQPVGIVSLDLNGFKQVNDTLGHHRGDLLLQHVANRLTECVRDTDTVARLGGDEFSILLPNVTSVADATEVARRVLDSLRQPLDLDGQPAIVGASIGVVIFPEHGADVELLLQHADKAMYTAKQGRLGICVAAEPHPTTNTVRPGHRGRTVVN